MDSIEANSEDYAYHRTLHFIAVFLDDVDGLLAFLRDNCASVELYAGRAIADEADDLLSATRKERRDIKLVAKRPNIVVRLSSAGTYVATKDFTKKSRDIVDDIFDMLGERRVKLLLPWQIVAILVSMALYWAVAGKVVLSEGAISAVTGPIFYTGASLASVISTTQFLYRHGRTWLILRWRRDLTLMSQDLQKSTILALLSALIGGVVTIILTIASIKE